jgi:hypothetical protein
MMPFSTLRRVLGIITAVATLVAVVMYGTAPTEDGEPPRMRAGSIEAPAPQAPTSGSYQGGEEDAHGDGVDGIDALRKEVAPLRDDLAAMQRRLKQLTRRGGKVERQDADHASAVSDGTLTIDPPRDPAAEMQKLEAESEQRILAQAEANGAALQKETEDPPWSGEARDLISGAVAAEELAATSVQDVECRATLCRVEVTHKDPQARAVFEGQLIMAVAQLLPQATMQTVEDEDGSSSTVLYLARDGHDFPQPEAAN